MALIYQLELFKDKNEVHLNTVEAFIEELRESHHKVRRGTYAKINEQGKEIKMIAERLEILERNICKNQESAIV